MAFFPLNSKGCALNWWKIHTKTLKIEGDPIVTKWKVFKTSSSPNYTLLGIERTNGSIGIAYSTSRGKAYKYTSDFRKMAIMLVISPKNSIVLLK